MKSAREETSWLWKRIVLDAIRECASWETDRFVDRIEALLDALGEHPLVVLDQGLGEILNRLAEDPPTDELVRLRELAVKRWGSPMLAARWPYWHRWSSEDARSMVAGWLARRVISTFFETLAGSEADPRRTEFWGKYAELIDEFWIFLSDDARQLAVGSIREMRAALGSTVGSIDHEYTNVFVMVIGKYAFVEFSTTGNALYVYARDRLPFDLRLGGLTVPKMKDKGSAVDRMTHQGAWEWRAVELVGDLTGIWKRRY